ncbi:MAG: RagB/SusD family nutrient uptake outer membrane protein [Prevotella sp.]|nr:RagB/SusD family nutrient uptake outer membrane protein [Prevotella sp.]
MKIKNIKYAAAATLICFSMTSCDNFLDKPVVDSYNTDNYYNSDDACISGVNYLYNSPWYDFQRGFIKVGEVFSGNMYWGSSPYMNFSVNGTDADLINMSYSLWSVIGHASTVYESLGNAKASASVKAQCMGECLAWKAMAYFYLVRTFGDVPIIHSNSETLTKGDYNTAQKVQKSDVYDYIILTLEKAMELLPKTKSTSGRIDYYCAEGLLAKVYLTKAGVSGQLNNDDLQKAATYAKDVVDNSGRELMPNYEDIFRGSNNNCDESLFAWRWTVGAHWTCQNSLQSDLAIEGFDENGDVWGGWGGPSYDLMLAFGVDPKDNPSKRTDKDARRKATIMMAGDTYSYFWRDHAMADGNKGFNYLQFIYDKKYNKAATGQLQGPCGGNNVKHLYGDDADHIAEMGMSSARMASALATHILRLADVYLVLAEAKVLMGKTTDADALAAFNAVHQRSVPSDVEKTSLTFDDIWKERRLEFAGEGDRWYDFVRRAYYDADACIAELKAQKRNAVWNVDGAYKTYFESGGATWDPKDIEYDADTPIPNVTKASFILPYPTEDVTLNPNLSSSAEPIHVDVRSTYSY